MFSFRSALSSDFSTFFLETLSVEPETDSSELVSGEYVKSDVSDVSSSTTILLNYFRKKISRININVKTKTITKTRHYSNEPTLRI